MTEIQKSIFTAPPNQQRIEGGKRKGPARANPLASTAGQKKRKWQSPPIGRGAYVNAPNKPHWSHNMGNAKFWTNAAVNNPGNTAAGAGLAGAGLAASQRNKLGPDGKRRTDTAAAAGISGAAAQYAGSKGVYQQTREYQKPVNNMDWSSDGKNKYQKTLPSSEKKKFDSVKSAARRAGGKPGMDDKQKIASTTLRQQTQNYNANFPEGYKTSAIRRHVGSGKAMRNVGRASLATAAAGGAAAWATHKVTEKPKQKVIKFDDKKAKAEIAAGAGGLTLAGSSNRIAFRRHTAQRKRIAESRSYLSQDKGKRDPAKINLNTAKKKEALRTINDASGKLKKLPAPKVMNRTAFWGTAAAGGAALVYDGGRRHFKKTKKDYDRAAGGALAGAGAYYGTGIGSNLYVRDVSDKKLKTDSVASLKVTSHSKKSFGRNGTRPAVGDPAWKKYNRSFPTDVPGGKLRRVTSYTHAGKTGLALTGAAALAGAAATKKKKSVSKKYMSDAEIRRRKKAQGAISRATSTLGLTALGATALGTRQGHKFLRGSFKSVNKPVPKALGEKKIKAAAVPLLTTSAGIGGLGGYNFAAYTSAESKRRVTTVKKPVTKNWTPVKGSYDPEAKRAKRNKRYEVGSAVVAGGAGYGAARSGLKTAESVKSLANPKYVKSKTLPRAKVIATAAHGGKTGALLALTGAAAVGNKKIREKRKGSWASYSKRDDLSAFGVAHD